MKVLSEDVRSSPSFHVAHVEYNDVALILRGEQWDFQSSGAWRLVKAGVIACCCLDSNARENLEKLRGQRIVDVRAQSRYSEEDPAFEFEDGTVLEIFSTVSDEPWLLHSTSGKVYVGLT